MFDVMMFLFFLAHYWYAVQVSDTTMMSKKLMLVKKLFSILILPLGS